MSANYRIAALLGETFSFKNSEFPLGTPVRIGYAFPVARPADWPEATFQSLTTPGADIYEMLVRDALALVEATCGIDFVETSASAARIQFGIASVTASNVAGYALTSYDRTLNQYVSSVVYDDSLPAAANMESTILHEIGHALGLKHPGAYGSGDAGPFLSASDDSTANTVMSYNFATADALLFGPYDIEALQYLYGPPIVAGIRVGESSGAAVRNGTAGNELFALNSYELWRYDNSTTFTDAGQGYRAAASGIDINAGAGIDEVYVPLARDRVVLTRQSDGSLTLASEWSVELSGGDTGTLTLLDQLRDVERLRFADGYLALDSDGAAGEAYSLLYAALDAPPPADLIGTWLPRFDAGLSAATVAGEILAAYAPGLPSATLVDVLYRNLFDAPPPAEVLADLTTLIDGGMYTQGEFYAAAAALDLNISKVVGLVDQGIFYI